MTDVDKAGSTGGKILYIDPFSGVSGDMFLGALISLGTPLEMIREAVERVIPGEVAFHVAEEKRCSLAGTRCRVEITGGPGRRSLDGLLDLVREADLPRPVRDGAVNVLNRLGKAEALAHGSAGSVHLHELGGQDTLADVVGTLAAVHALSVDRVQAGPINLGAGTVRTEHGVMPVPAPATAFLLEGVPVRSMGPEVELTTPTGAALVTEIAGGYGPVPPMTITKVGTGAGGRDNEGYPNLLRVFLGRLEGPSAADDRSVMIECGLDDVSPEYLAPLTELLQGSGALEVHVIPAPTKKGRLGVLVRVLASPDDRERLVRILLDHSGTAGLRYWDAQRVILPREIVTVSTPHGEVRVKRWLTPSGVWRAKPEYEDVREIAQRTGMAAGELRDRVMAIYYGEKEGRGDAETRGEGEGESG